MLVSLISLEVVYYTTFTKKSEGVNFQCLLRDCNNDDDDSYFDDGNTRCFYRKFSLQVIIFALLKTDD